MFNLVDDFCKTVQRQPEHLAIVDQATNRTLTYAQLRDEIEAAGARLKAAGIRPGECVGLHVPSGTEYVIINYGLWRCGACVVPIPVELTPEEKLDICKNISMTSVVSAAATARVLSPMQNGEPQPLDERNVLVPIEPEREPPAGFAAVNGAFIRFSSGTTGSSKGVVLSHESIYDRIQAANDGLEIGPEDCVIWLLSMSYHFAVSIVAYLSFGATMVICKNHLGRTIIKATAEHEGTLIYGSPVHYNMMAHDRGDVMLPSLRLAISTATALPKKTADAFLARFERPLTQAYGIIEIGLPCINLKHPDRFDAVGQVLPGYELNLVDTGMEGGFREIKFRGKGFLDAYYEPWRPRDEIMDDGWFSTGDLGELDEDGCLFIRGRSKEAINVSGMKFFPQEVEAVLQSHPAVKEVAVYPQNHDRFGEIGHANVVLKDGIDDAPTEAALSELCASRLADFKVPARIHFVAELPRTGSGKVLRRAVEGANT